MGTDPDAPRLADRGINDIVRISDARMSGTSFGTVVLHVAWSRRQAGRSRSFRLVMKLNWTPQAAR